MSWQPIAPVENLRVRAQILEQIRGFFRERDVLEVQTPVLASTTVTDANIQSISVPGYGFLQTSPEFHMKRLLAAGMPSCYQIAQAFRDDEQGVWHNPEFTMLEWYRIDFSMQELIQEVKDICDLILGPSLYRETTVSELLGEVFETDVLELDEKGCLETAREAGLLNCDDYEDAVDFLVSRAVSVTEETRLVITNYPEHGAALAKIQQKGNRRFAQRFEFAIDGVEVANGYDELLDADELRQRMLMDNARRKRKGLALIEQDEKLLAAMASGLPKCAGVAVGLDRLVALCLNAHAIDEVIAFR